MKKVLKYLGRVLLAIFIFVIVVVFLLYLPPVQNFLRRQLVSYVSERYDGEVRLGKLKLGFPLKLEIQDVFLGRTGTDTLVAADTVLLHVGLSGIWKGNVSVDELRLNGGKLAIANDSSGMQLQVDVAKLTLRAREVDWRERRITAGYIRLSDGNVNMVTGTPTPADTMGSKPFDWSFLIDRIELDRVGYRMISSALPELSAGLENALLTGGEVRLGKQDVKLDSLQIAAGWCKLRTGTDQPEPATKDTADTTEAWTVRVGSVELQNSAFRMEGNKNQTTQLVLSGIGIRMDSIYNRGTVIRASLKDLKAVQQGGTRIAAMRAEVDLGTSLTSLRGTYLETPYSKVFLEAEADTSFQYLLEKVPLRLKADGYIGMSDVAVYYPDLPRELWQKTVHLSTFVGVSGARLDLNYLLLEMPGQFRLTVKGKMTDYRQIRQMQGDWQAEGTFQDVRWMTALLGDAGFAIPQGLQLSCQGTADRGAYRANGRLCRGKGCLQFDGAFDGNSREYAGTLNLTDFPVGDFLPADSLGSVSARVQLKGHDFTWSEAVASLNIGVGHLTFKRYDYRDIALEARLNKTRITGTITSADRAIPLNLIFRGDSAGELYALTLNGQLGDIDLKTLNIVQDSLAVGMEIDLRATAVLSEERYSLEAHFDSLRLKDARSSYRLRNMDLDLKSNRKKTGLRLETGDLHLTFQSDTSLTGIAAGAGKAAELIRRQIEERDVNMQDVSRELPDFVLKVEGGQKNAIAGFLKTSGITFRNLVANIYTRQRGGLRLGLQVNAPHFGNVRLDSLHIGAWQSGSSLVYDIGAGSSAESWKGLLNLNMAGRIQGDHLRFELKQKDAQGNIGFDLGMNLTMRDSSFIVSLFPMSPILGYSRWVVNTGNQITIYKDWKIQADLRLAYQNKLVSLQSLADEGDIKERLKVDIKGIDLASLARLVPFMPEMKGILNTNLLLYSLKDSQGVDGHIHITDMAYQKQTIGTLDLGLRYNGRNGLTDHAIDFELKIDSIRRAVLLGSFSTSADRRDLSVDIDMPSFPLYIVNAFLPDDLLKLQGDLVGKLRMRGTVDRPQINGSLEFEKASADVVMLGTIFRMDTTVLAVDDGKIAFRNYRFIAPNNSNLLLDGNITLVPFDRMGMDMNVSARDFEVVNVRKNETSLVYGKAYVDIDARIFGGFSALTLTGNSNLLNQTNITYTLRSSDPELVDRSADLVRFVSFRDSTLNETDDLTNRVQANSFALRMLIEIGDQVNVTVELSEDGSNNITIQGGGNLVLALNPESGLTLSGKYILSGGTVVYNIPIAGKKEFMIRNGSYVEWTGAVANPILNISAAESVKATVEDGDRNRLVTFEAIIRIQNSLTHPDITFDLSAPNDMVIQNQLATFSPEERTRQALNLLIYNTYTAPGAAKSGNSNMANNALYSFVENELNKYTRKAGITLGVDSYNTDENTIRRDFTYEFSRQLFNDRIRVRIGGRISTDNNDVQQNSLEDNLVDDISIEYVLTKKRNLYLKVFRHSNYESVLDGEVTQTGVGIVWRKNFLKLRDLFRKKGKINKENKNE